MSEYFHEDEADGKSYDGRLIRRLIRYLRPYKKNVVAGIALLLVVAGLEIIGPILTQIAIDKYVTKGDYEGLRHIVFLYILVLGSRFLFEYAHNYVMSITGQYVMYDIRKAIFKHLQTLSLSFFDKNPVGRLVTRLTSDVDTLNEMFTSGVVTIFGDFFILIGIIGVLIYYNAGLALLTFSVLPLMFYATFLFKKKVRVGFQKIRSRIARINSFLHENISGMRIVQLFNREKRNFAQFDAINKSHTDAHIETVFYHAVFYPSMELISSFAIAIIVWYGGSQVLREALTFGFLVAFIQYAQRFYRPIQDLSEKYTILQSAMASSERIFGLLDQNDSLPDPAVPVAIDGLKGNIDFKDVWFAYDKENYVLKDINFSMHEGQSVALVGHTGAGKSTIINLLGRFYDVRKGSITIDGVDIRAMRKADLRKHIGIVLQDVFLFSGDIQGNITLNNSDISEEKVRMVAEKVNAARFIRNLPGEYHAEVKERGSTLSTGQKQLLAFARALAYDPRILILDEATSNIDTDTELLIQDAVKTLMKGRTSIVIAHRLSTIQNVDKIIVMHHGRIREMGTHQELLAHGGIYFKLYQLQYKEQEMKSPVLTDK